MKASVFCTPTAKGVHSFYLTFEGKEYYLFQQNYRKGVQKFYSNGVSLNAALKITLAHGDVAILRTMEKLPMYIKYVEKEYGIAVLEQTQKKQKTFRRCVA